MSLPDKSHLAKPSRSRTDGWMPDETPRFGPALVERIHAAGKLRDEEWASQRHHARFSHSSAGACSRAIAYAALGLPKREADEAQHFVSFLGQMLHEEIQDSIKTAIPGSIVEHEVTVHLLGEETTGHVDTAVWHGDGEVVAIEYKSVGGFKYKLIVGERGPAKGPDYSHLIQASLNGRALDASEVVIVYIAREAISIQQAEKAGLDPMGRVVAEYTLDRETYEEIADKELERVKKILSLIDEGQLPRRNIPDPELPHGNVVTNPTKGEWAEVDREGNIVDVGSTWHCLYCAYQTTCARTSGEREDISSLREQGVLP